MADRADDLAPLINPPDPPGVGYRQGVLTAWNAGTAANTVVVDGVAFTNLPVLSTAGLAAGAVVALLTVGPPGQRSSWLILGKLTIPT